MEKSYVLPFKKKAVLNDIKNQNTRIKGSAEILVCVALLILSAVLSFVLEYASLLYKAEIFKEDLRIVMESALEEEAKNSLYELRHYGKTKETQEKIEKFLKKYTIEGATIERIELDNVSGYRAEGTLLLNFQLGSKTALTIRIPFYEQKVYRYISEEDE